MTELHSSDFYGRYIPDPNDPEKVIWEVPATLNLRVTPEEAHEIRVALSVASIQLEGWVAENPTDEENEDTKARIALILALLDKIPLT